MKGEINTWHARKKTKKTEEALVYSCGWKGGGKCASGRLTLSGLQMGSLTTESHDNRNSSKSMHPWGMAQVGVPILYL